MQRGAFVPRFGLPPPTSRADEDHAPRLLPEDRRRKAQLHRGYGDAWGVAVFALALEGDLEGVTRLEVEHLVFGGRHAARSRHAAAPNQAHGGAARKMLSRLDHEPWPRGKPTPLRFQDLLPRRSRDDLDASRLGEALHGEADMVDDRALHRFSVEHEQERLRFVDPGRTRTRQRGRDRRAARRE